MKKACRLLVLPLSLAALLAANGCLSSSRIVSDESVADVLSPKLNPFVYFEDGPIMFVGVDGRAAQYSKEDSEKILPLGLGLANQMKTPLTFDRESFVLETSDGTRYPVVSVEEYNRDYTRSQSDRRLAEQFLGDLATRFRNYRYVDRQLFPYRGSTETANNSFELGRLFWTHMYLYFPMPEGGIHGKEFNLLVTVNEVPETLVVHFKLR